MKNLLIITMLLGVGYSQCNESNWQDYYPDMQECDLSDAYLIFADFSQADLSKADLSNADLTGANCYGTSFVQANLEGTIFDGASMSWTYFDENGDYYDDASYEAGYDTGASSGELNLDGIDNVLDVVILVDNILNP